MTHDAHDPISPRSGTATWSNRLFTALILVLIVFVLVVLPLVAAAQVQPLYLYGTEGDDDTLYRLDVNGAPPTIVLLGDVRDDITNGHVFEMEAMTWDPDLGRIFVVSNAGSGPLYKINPSDITGPPAMDIPATKVGNTGTIQMEGVALNLETDIMYGVDNSTDPARLKIVDKFTGMITSTVGPLVDGSGEKYDNMEGLAFTFDEPYVLYGTNNPGEGLSTLVTIDTSTGLVTPVGPVGYVNVECLVFGPDGTLYGFSNGNGLVDYFITIDINTGAGSLFNTVDPSGLDIEGCVILEPGVQVSVEEKSWSSVKTLYQR
jgi:hypothetical protein